MWHYILDQSMSCEGCINARICIDTTGRYHLNFTKLVDRSLTNSPCELRFNNTVMTLTEGHCVELTSTHNYSIWCPICTDDCYDNCHDVNYHVIPNPNEDCLNSGNHNVIHITYSIYVYILI